VVSVTAFMVDVETMVPSLIGLALRGDGVHGGFQRVAVVGVLLVLAGSVALVRLGELPDQRLSRPRGRGTTTPRQAHGLSRPDRLRASSCEKRPAWRS
jgi:hypothetical protein